MTTDSIILNKIQLGTTEMIFILNQSDVCANIFLPLIYFSFLNIIAGTMGHEIAPAKLELEQGSLYCLGLDGSLKHHVGKISISNGLAWSADNKTMYYIDSIPRKVYAFDYDIDTGNIGKTFNGS